MKRLFIINIFIFLAVISFAGPRDFVDRVFVSSAGQRLPYKMLLPEDYDPEEEYPLVLFLHGSGEKGYGNKRQIYYGGKMLRTDENLKKAIVIAPQCPLTSYWAEYLGPAFINVFPKSPRMSKPLIAVKELTDSLVRGGQVDEDRIYGIGFSMGAFGLLDLAVRYPDMFEAIISICGGINTQRLEGFKGQTAFRFYHGKMDYVILPVFSRKTHKTLKEQGIQSELIEYPWVCHNSWNKAFKEPDFTKWLFEN